MPRQVNIDPLSGTSLKVEPTFNDTVLPAASGFVVGHGGKHYLITNWHVLTGRNPETGEPVDRVTAAIPNGIRVTFHKKDDLGLWVTKDLPLFSDEQALWLEHPRGREVDVVALPLPSFEDVSLFDLDLALSQVDVALQPGAQCFVIGFPLGLATGSAWPIWKTAHLASDHLVDYRRGEPTFLIDATTRGGMSGSPVVFRTFSSFNKADGTMVFANGATTKFLGIYSGRIHENAEVGKVWRPYLITEILEKRIVYGEETGVFRATERNRACECGSGKRYKHCHGSLADSVTLPRQM